MVRSALAHVPLEVIGEHTEQHMGSDAIGQTVMDRANFEINRLD